MTLVHLPDGRDAETMAKALVETMKTLPTHLRRSLTWDQGSEMAGHKIFSMAADMPVFFCDPASPLATGIQREHQWIAAPILPRELIFAFTMRRNFSALRIP